MSDMDASVLFYASYIELDPTGQLRLTGGDEKGKILRAMIVKRRSAITSVFLMGEQMSLTVINFFGAPGAGKSTAAAGLFYTMKRAWVSCEMVREFAKDLVISRTEHLLSYQNWVFANQEKNLSSLRGQFDFAISDAPLPIQAFYSPPGYPESFERLCFDLFDTYDNINYFINRHPGNGYENAGRLQTEAESDEIAKRMKSYLRENGVPFTEMVAGDQTPMRIFEQLRASGRITSDPTIMP